MKADELRKKFLTFFESKGHTVVPSDSLVPREDPTLLFTSAGMNQFKDQFIGHNITYRRAASCQRCLRTADLEKVGKTPYHHTFFEMLGNFSFGDYFKQDAISWAWEFMTKILKLPKTKLWVSVYKDDDDAYNIWRDKVGILEKKIVKLGDKENFWPSNAKKDGPNGPCGPCSEIFYDWGDKVGCKRPGCDPSCDCGRFVEVWNLVFTQFNRTGVDRLEPLSNKNIDTGMGLERLASVMQGVYTNFETDLFKPIIEAIAKLLKPGSLPVRQAGRIQDPCLSGRQAGSRMTIYAIADHIRAVSFAILDGVMPSNEGRGYVIRKLIRTSFLHGRSLGLKEPFLYKLTFSVAKAMEEPYPQMRRRHEDIAGVIKSEEEFFRQHLDLDRARILYEEKFKEFPSFSKEEITSSSAKVACFMNDTYGIPPELIKEVARGKNHILDSGLWQGAYEECVGELRERSRKKSAFLKEAIFAETEAPRILSSVEETAFVGYKTTKAEAMVIKIFKDNKEIEELKESGDLQIILDKTPFYAEAGGQVGDSGVLRKGATKIEVLDAKRIDGVFVHIGKLIKGSIKVGDQIEAEVDKDRRESIARHHTATHLLQNALRKVLGEHVHQSGSVVDEKHLRFDFTHSKKLLPKELEKIEDIVNANIQNADAIKIKDEVELERAMDEGAIALFGEKYGKLVRVVNVGDYSKELCGGIHVAKTSEIRLFKIVSEGSVAAGLRRIEAITDEAVDKYILEEEKKLIEELKDTLSSIEGMLPDLNDQELKAKTTGVLSKVKKVSPTIKIPLPYKEYIKWERDAKPNLTELIKVLENLKAKIEKKIFSLRLKNTKILVDEIVRDSPKIKNTLIVAREIRKVDVKILRSLADEIKSKIESAIIVLAAQRGGKISFVCTLTSDLVKKGLHAGKIVKDISAIASGGGGGREDFALAGGKDPSKLSKALDYAYTISKQELEK